MDTCSRAQGLVTQSADGYNSFVALQLLPRPLCEVMRMLAKRYARQIITELEARYGVCPRERLRRHKT